MTIRLGPRPEGAAGSVVALVDMQDHRGQREGLRVLRFDGCVRSSVRSPAPLVVADTVADAEPLVRVIVRGIVCT